MAALTLEKAKEFAQLRQKTNGGVYFVRENPYYDASKFDSEKLVVVKQGSADDEAYKDGKVVYTFPEA